MIKICRSRSKLRSFVSTNSLQSQFEITIIWILGATNIFHICMTCFVVQIPQDPNSSDPARAENQMITCLAVSPSEENLVCTTDVNQLYTIPLSSADAHSYRRIRSKVSLKLLTHTLTCHLSHRFIGVSQR